MSEEVRDEKCIKIDGNFISPSAVVSGSFPVIPDIDSKVGQLDIYLRVDASVDAIISANGACDLPMIMAFAEQILRDVAQEVENRKIISKLSDSAKLD